MFLGVITGVLQYYGMFHKFNAWVKSREKVIFKLQRWILGIPNQKLLSFSENSPDLTVSFLSNGDVSYDGSILSKDSHELICDTFHDIDQKLFFGVSFRFLSRLMKNLRVIESKTEGQKKLMDESQYHRKINRKCCGVNLKKFISIVTSLKPLDQDMRTWIDKVVTEMRLLEDDQIQWEKKYIPIRIELIKMFSVQKSEKKEFISNLLIDNPFMRIHDLGETNSIFIIIRNHVLSEKLWIITS